MQIMTCITETLHTAMKLVRLSVKRKIQNGQRSYIKVWMRSIGNWQV